MWLAGALMKMVDVMVPRHEPACCVVIKKVSESEYQKYTFDLNAWPHFSFIS